MRRGHRLLGPHGAGKTTLLRTLLGRVTPDAGTVEVLGLPRRLDGPVHGVAGLVEAPQTWPCLTGRRSLELLAILDGGGAGLLVDDALDRVGLASRADTHAVPVHDGLELLAEQDAIDALVLALAEQGLPVR